MTLDKENVTVQFLRASGVKEEEFCHSTLIENAIAAVTALLNRPPEELSGQETAMCEYAAAAVAVYDFMFEKCIKDRLVMSEGGEISSYRDESGKLTAALKMKENALYMLRQTGIAMPYGFAFITA